MATFPFLEQALVDAPAREWFAKRYRGGGHALDLYLTSVHEIFAQLPAESIQTVAIPGSEGTRRGSLIIGIDLPVDVESGWEQIEDVFARVNDLLSEFRGGSEFGWERENVRRALDRVSVVLIGAPADDAGLIRQAIEVGGRPNGDL